MAPTLQPSRTFQPFQCPLIKRHPHVPPQFTSACSHPLQHQSSSTQQHLDGSELFLSTRRQHVLRAVAVSGSAALGEVQLLQPPMQQLPYLPCRRTLLLASAVLSLGLGNNSQAEEEDGGPAETITYTNPKQGYTLQRPAQYEQLDKAGADVLFRDPEQKSTTVGVTVTPVRIASLQDFGSLDTVGERLLDAEKAKESTLSVEMLSQKSRPGAASGATIYDFEYELESTRGRKRILSTVSIASRKLYIVNASVKCDKASCAGVEGSAGLLRGMCASFDVVVK